jgi:hypothetical protein
MSSEHPPVNYLSQPEQAWFFQSYFLMIDRTNTTIMVISSAPGAQKEWRRSL